MEEPTASSQNAGQVSLLPNEHYGVVSTPMLILFPRFFVDLKPKGAKCVKTSLATNDKYGNMSRVSGEKKAQKSLCIAHLEVVKRPRGRNWGHAL